MAGLALLLIFLGFTILVVITTAYIVHYKMTLTYDHDMDMMHCLLDKQIRENEERKQYERNY